MRRQQVFGLLLAASVVFGGAQAALAGAQSLLFMEQLNQLDSSGFETILPTPDVNDPAEQLLYVGILKVNEVSAAGGTRTATTDTFTAAFVMRVLEITDPTLSVNGGITLEKATAADWVSVGLRAPNSADTVLVLFDDNDAPMFIDPSLGLGAAFDTAQGATGSENPTVWEFGFAGGGTDFWAITRDQINLAGDEDITYEAVLSLTDTGIGRPLRDIVGTSQLFVDGQVTAPAPTATFDFGTTTQLFLKPVPEPASLAMLCGLMGMGLVGIVRYRRKKAA